MLTNKHATGFGLCLVRYILLDAKNAPSFVRAVYGNALEVLLSERDLQVQFGLGLVLEPA